MFNYLLALWFCTVRLLIIRLNKCLRFCLILVCIRFLDPHVTISVKYTTHNIQIDLLDTTTYKGPSFPQTYTVGTKVFFRDTDTHALLHKNSLHPKHTFKGLIKSQLPRFNRICTQDKDFEEATKTLFNALKPRGYSRSFLRRVRKTFLTTRQQDTKNNPADHHLLNKLQIKKCNEDRTKKDFF